MRGQTCERKKADHKNLKQMNSYNMTDEKVALVEILNVMELLPMNLK